MIKIKSSEITPEHVYLSRRKFLQAMGMITGHALLTACRGPGQSTSMPAADVVAPVTSVPHETQGAQVATKAESLPTASAAADELGNALTPLEAIANYTNYYEFSVRKEAVAGLVGDFETSPWSIQVGGLVEKPRRFDLDDLRKFESEERIYRMRCVEAWSMVIPWLGFPLAKLLKVVEPQSNAKYVRFETFYDPNQMPGTKSMSLPWPYVEGLRLDEALHDLTLLATGLYGNPLPVQNGAPARLVVPWKYGFKSIKSIVKIELVEYMPTSLWMASGPNEYGFWANVNPDVPHPRWSQATERLIGENKRRATLLFNGYAEEVAELYPDLDDRQWYY
ncbi:MAG: protein-methionine-sulfoxide reductase catalytic subunit MsrP [Anaerolineae bacterium]|nr:protein-methionine-sulfoxide reductase catalytic subunit MsrP [Anaerolineae bacterium]